MTFKEIQTKVHKNAVEHGWWDKEQSFGDFITNTHCELSEAFEEYRNGHAVDITYLSAVKNNKDWEWIKPEGIPTELADVVIRIMDYCEHANIDLESAILEKHKYNMTREYRHGGKIV